ncbi:MAG TPA: type I methionyl aminopeptidase [Nitrospiraceae bacterium]|nr:MAG: type I methionyl aminopeptidase [Nitrospirae bacterium RIFCSPLOWO2_02_42_7]OGW58906.1 MAG: type I methionyl aminopeptidase [Nitrospirae bacterium RIFCSPHIGHO2_02_FULL_42_12]HAS17099.1 type I methionyl aminopeptidase [Nitrospiraceae bacterium]HBI23631.1 type I methionyl aminopeptidase [Nitrospiraceae bacterium]
MIILKSSQEIERIRTAGAVVAGALEELKKRIYPGITTRELDKRAEEFLIKKGGTPAFKGYKGYPDTICISINEEVVHGIPSERKLAEGDIVSIDIGVLLDGYYGDAAITLPVGRISSQAKHLLEVTEASLYKAIDISVIGKRVSDISNTIQCYVEGAGYSVVRDFVGHGIGRSLHEEPPVPNYGEPGKGPRLKAGMVLAIEPMVNMGGHELIILENGWTTVTKDGSLSAHFEHTVVITENGPLILTML